MLLFRQFARQRLLAVFETWVRLCPLVQRFAQTRQQIQQEQAARAWRRSQVEFVSPSLLQQAGYLHAEVERVPSQRRSVFAGLPIEDREPAIPHARVPGSEVAMPEAARNPNFLQIAAGRGQGCLTRLLPSPVAAPSHLFPRAPTSSTTWSPDLSTRRMAANLSRNSTCMLDSSAGPGRPSSGDWNNI